MKVTKSDLETFREARPFLRSILAFLIYLRFEHQPIDCYPIADFFLNRLEAELSEQAQ